jgi:hypothetical protein
MKVGGIGGIPANVLTTERGTLKDRDLVQLEDNMFGPAYRVAISEKGRNLLEEKMAQKKTGTQGTQMDEGTRMLLRQLEEDQQARKTRNGYYDELEELEKQIKVMNAAYGSMNRSKAYNDPLMKEVVKQQQLLQEEMQEQKDFQAEEALKRLKEAQQAAAMRTSRHQEEIDENNRDLVTLLKTVEEAKKAEEEQKDNSVEGEDSSASGTENSTSGAIHNSATGLMKSSLNHERGVEELSDMVSDGGHYFLSKADGIAQNLLKKSKLLKVAVQDESFTIGQLEEAMESFRSEVKTNCEEAYIFGSFGTQVLRDMRDVKLQRIADNPLQSMQQIKDGMMQAASDAALGEALQSSINETSQELADEVEELIDERNGVDRTPEEKKEGEGEEDQEKGQIWLEKRKEEQNA